MTTIRQVNQYINTYNKAADAFNKNRKTLAPIARKNTKQGKVAYKKTPESLLCSDKISDDRKNSPADIPLITKTKKSNIKHKSCIRTSHIFIREIEYKIW